MTEPSISTTMDNLPLGPGVRILNHNEDGLVALEKPVGVMAHPNKGGDEDKSLLTATYHYDKEVFSWIHNGVQHQAWLINRIDSPTSGVILIALDQELSVIIKRQFATHKVTKVYYALVKNAPSQHAAIWDDQLRKDVYRGNKLIKGGQRIPAKARYQLMKSPTGGFPVALLRLTPVTGRTHQLRVQCKKHGHPIVGDRTYGSFSFNREVKQETRVKRMLLHSAETFFRYAFKGAAREFKATSPIPEEFNDVLRFRPGLHHGSQARQASRLKPSATETESKTTALEGRRFKGE